MLTLMRRLRIAGMAVVLSVAAVSAPAQQDEGPIVKPKTQSNPKTSTGTILVICDLACNWKLDGEAKGSLDADELKKVSVSLGEHRVDAVTADGLDKTGKDIDIKTAAQRVVHIDLLPVRDARLKAQQEEKDKVSQEQSAQQEADRQRASQEQEARDKAARERADKEKVPQERAGNYTPTLTIKDPAEFNAYQTASTLENPSAKASALESFLTSYPQTVVKRQVLNALEGIYWGLQDRDNTLGAANRVLQVDPNNVQAVIYLVFIKKQQCGATQDSTTCSAAVALAKKGLSLLMPAEYTDDQWQRVTHTAYPVYHATIALDAAMNKDYKTAQDEYTAELQLYSEQEEKTTGLNDTLLLAQAYSEPGNWQDLKKAIWLYARVWDFAPANYKPQIESRLEYYYRRYHGSLDGMDAIKRQAEASVFPTGEIAISPAKAPTEQIHDLVASTPDLSALALDDKETILALGSKEDADRMWAVLKDKTMAIPAIVIEATANQFRLAVSPNARASGTADFIVNLKTSLSYADLADYPRGFEFKSQPGAMIAGTFDSYARIPASNAVSASAQFILRDGAIIPARR